MNMKIAGIFIMALHAAPAAQAQSATPKSDTTLPLTRYLDQVKGGSPEARGAVEAVRAAELRLDIAIKPFTPEVYSEFKLFDNREEPTNPIMPKESRGRSWKVGVKDQTTFGLSADAYFDSKRTELLGLNPAFPMPDDYEQSALGINFTQSLWRNGFGEASRAQVEAQKAQSRIELLQAQFRLKNLMLQAENTYWSLVSFNEIIKLQTENVDRAKRLRDHMRERASMRLFDDVDAMQTEASYQQRELELLSSVNQRATFLRQFNSLRGGEGERAEPLEDLPTSEFMLATVKDPRKRMSREDFRVVFEQATQLEQKARGSESGLRPQLDLVAGISGNGLDSRSTSSYRESFKGQNPDWNVGLVFSMPLDYRLIRDTMASYEADKRSAKAMQEQSRFDEDRAWDDLIKRNREAQTIFERSLALEKLQTELVKRERQRFLNGRSTTQQSVTIEQNLAQSQISRVQAQLALLQIHNLIKQFQEIQ